VRPALALTRPRKSRRSAASSSRRPPAPRERHGQPAPAPNAARASGRRSQFPTAAPGATALQGENPVREQRVDPYSSRLNAFVVSDSCQITESRPDNQRPRGWGTTACNLTPDQTRTTQTTAGQNCHAGGRGFESRRFSSLVPATKLVTDQQHARLGQCSGMTPEPSSAVVHRNRPSAARLWVRQARRGRGASGRGRL
jgi:hypothetical protein